MRAGLISPDNGAALGEVGAGDSLAALVEVIERQAREFGAITARSESTALLLDQAREAIAAELHAARARVVELEAARRRRWWQR